MAVTSVEQAAQGVWARVTEKARSELPESSFAMWFSEVRPASLDGDVLQLGVPSEYVRDWLVRHYLPLIQTAASEAAGSPLRVRVVAEPSSERPVAQGSSDTTVEIPEAPSKGSGDGVSSLLFPDRYTFDAFVPGASNRFAHAAAMAVAEARPSKAYNPLFIYGGVGLGKTHLLFATGHHMMRLMPGLRVKYVTSETFVTEFIKAVRERQGYQFQRRYRDVDVLLVDDIQFLARREETQTEFFHTFNALHEAERQIVIASDRPPQELSGMEERLRNRFRWGLCVDVQPPDLETRIAILQLKAQRDNIDVPNEVVDFIASKFDQNIRELEGALLRAAAFSSLTGQPIDIELAERALADLLPQTEIEIPPALIVDETAAYFGLTRADLVSKNRSRPLTTARHIAMYLLRETTSLSLIKIGEIFDRDHSTAMHGINKVQNDMSARGSTYRQVQDLTRQIRSRVRGG
ncbi:MAG: chromosomal replication initiator protein DnaA [Actinomycetota bacterium]